MSLARAALCLFKIASALFIVFGTGAQATVPETVEVIGSRSGLGPGELTGQLSVIDREHILALNKTGVQQLLESLTGLSVSQQGGAGGITSLYVRGGEPNFAVIMIDGVQVNNPVDSRGGSFDFSTLDTSQVERIELIRGPQSAVYGADALSGVLNIVTRQPEEAGAVQLRAEGGGDDYYRLGGSLQGTIGRGGAYAATLGYSDAGDVVEGSRRELDFFSAAARYALTDARRLHASIRYSDSERSSFPEDSGGPEYAVWRELDEAQSQDLSLQLGWHSRVGTNWNYTLLANWFSLDSEKRSPGIYPGFEVPPNGAETQFDRYQLSWVNRLRAGNWRIGLGLDLEREEGDSEGYVDFGVVLPTNFELERDSTGVFIELYREVGSRLSLSASLRHDDPEDVDAELSGRLGVIYRLAGERTDLRLNWGEGFKPPSFFALAHPLVGNPRLQAETANSWDAGIEHRVSDGLRVNLVYFDNRYRDLIDFDDELFTNVNRASVDSRGMELTLVADLERAGEWRGHATWTDIDVNDSDETLRGRPKWKAGLQWFYPVSSSIDLSVDYLWVDERAEASRHSGTNVDYTLADYTRVDLSLTWRPRSEFRLQGTVGNLFDEDYEQAVGFSGPGLQGRLAVEWAL